MHISNAQTPIGIAERARRRRYLAATLVTCAALAMVGGAIHVVSLGSNRMAQMRDRAGYDVADMGSRIRAAGEEVGRQDLHRENKLKVKTYTVAEADTLLPAETWRDVDATILIPAGAFTMGSSAERVDPQDKPAHAVNLSAYRIDKYLVTNAQYARFVAASGYRSPLHWKGGKIPAGELMRPVTMVSWFDASKYCAWAGKRIPTEAEWEKAARGTDGRRWPWGDKMDPTRLNTYYSVGATSDVTAYPRGASPYGVMDMAGNVSEWIADDFVPYPGSDAPSELFKAKVGIVNTAQDRAMKVVDMVPLGGAYKVMRGGSWKGDPFSTASYHRNYSLPHYASDFFGFRCAQDIVNGQKSGTVK